MLFNVIERHLEERLYLIAEKLNSFPNAFVEVHLGLPTQHFTCSGDIRLTNFGIIDGKWLVLDLGRGAGDAANFFTELSDGHFARVADIHRFVKMTLHESEDAVNEIGYKAKAAGLTAIAKDRHGLASKSLADEGWHHAAIIEAHPRTIGIKNTNDVGVHLMEAMVGHRDGFCEALRLIVNSARADGIHVAPVIFRLRVDERIAVALRGGSQKKSSVLFPSQAEGIVSAQRAHLECRDRDSKVIDRASRTCKMPNVIHFAWNKNIFRDIVADEFEVGVAREMLDIRDIPSDEIVDSDDAMSLFEQAIAQVGTEKS